MATMVDNVLFVDTNILIYATDPASPFHRDAFNRLQQARLAGTNLVVSPQIMREYLAASTRSVAPGDTSSRDDVLNNIETFRTQFTLVEDSLLVLDALTELLKSVFVAGKQIHDANIVATMRAYGISTLLTHNTKDFARFSHLITVQPLI